MSVPRDLRTKTIILVADERCNELCFEEKLSRISFFSEKRSFRAKIAFFDDMVICVTKVYFSVQMTQLRQTFSVKYFYFFCEIDVFYKIKIHYCPHLYNGKDRRRL